MSEQPWGKIRTALEQERRGISAEIGSYPSPIPACDEQFNYLLERRDRISRALAWLHRRKIRTHLRDDPS